MTDFLIYELYEQLKTLHERLDIQLEMIETITEALRSAQKEIEDLKQRICDDDCR